MARVAVIGVHGVADQKPGETVQAVARILQAESTPASTSSEYSAFVQERLNIPIRKLSLTSPPSGRTLPAKLKESRSFDERPPYVRWLHAQKQNPHELANRVQQDANIEFTYDQVCYYDPRHSQRPDRDNRVYETVRMKGQRMSCHDDGSKTTDDVDIYEFFWADLSRLPIGVLNILSAFYQLLFHVCSLGRDTLDLAEPEFRCAGPLRRFQWGIVRMCHAVATTCLSLAIPVLNMCLAGILLIALPAKVPRDAEVVASICGAGLCILTGGLIGRLLRAARPEQPPGRYGAIITASILVIFSMIYSPEIARAVLGRASWSDIAWKKVLTVEWGLISSAAIGAILIAYSKRKPQILIVGAFLWLPSAASIAYLVHRAEPTEAGLAQAAIAASVVLILILHVVWIVMSLAVLTAGLVSIRSWMARGCGNRLHRALATGIVSMIGPTTLFAFITLALCSPLLSLADLRTMTLPDEPLSLEIFGREIPGLQNARLQDAIHWMFQLSVTGLADGILFVWIAAGFLIVCQFFWPVWAESLRPSSRPADRSQFIGEELSNAFGSLGIVFGLLGLAFPIAFLIGSVINWYGWMSGLPPQKPGGVFALLGAIVFGLGATGKLGTLVDKIWPALDVTLDVDNYLQGRPWDCNPKARIMTRYVSLLRYLASQKYDALVLVSHSQGTVITADTLRFLRVQPDPALASLGFGVRQESSQPHPFPIALLTMGSPLRQLYGWRFPHLYHWARHEGGQLNLSGANSGAAIGNGPIADTCRPDPREIGVRFWVNAYNSGDYVGRHVWRDDNLARPRENSQYLFDPWNHNSNAESLDNHHTRRELCFGSGAHTHYFDDNASDVARIVDQMINDTCT